MFGEGFDSFHGLPRLVAWGWPAVLQAGWASGSGLGGSGHIGGTGGLHAEVAEPPPNPGRGELTRLRRPLPGPAKVLGEGAGEAELGVGGDDQPGPEVGRVRVADLGNGPAQGLLEQPEGVFKIEPVGKRLSPQVDVCAGHPGA